MKEETKKQASKKAKYWRYRLDKFQELHPELSKREDSKKEYEEAILGIILGFSIEIGTSDATYYWSGIDFNDSYNKVTVKNEGVLEPYILLRIGEPHEMQGKSLHFDDKDKATQLLLRHIYRWYKDKPVYTAHHIESLKMCLAMVQNLA